MLTDIMRFVLVGANLRHRGNIDESMGSLCILEYTISKTATFSLIVTKSHIDQRLIKDPLLP